MSTIGLEGQVMTVLGPIAPAEVGVCLPHEHLLVDLSQPYFREPDDPRERAWAHEPFTVERRPRVIADFSSHLDNLRLTDRELIAAELHPLVDAGGRTVVELTSIGIGRDALGLRAIAETTGLNVVMGTGWYIGTSHPYDLSRRDEEDLADEMVRDITHGVADSGIRAGIIGEIGFQSFTEDERKVLRAAALAQHRCGATINVHIEFILSRRQGALEAVEILEEAEADLSRVILSHQDSSGADPEYQELVLGKGIVLEYDGFGYEMHTAALGGLDYPTDKQRMRDVLRLVNNGWAHQLLISTDVCMKLLLKRFGGLGYGHILTEIVPRLRRAGMSEYDLHAILIDTPARLLTLAPAM